MTTNHCEESDDEFRLDASLQSFEKSLRQHEPRRVELDAMQLSNARSRWSSKCVTLSPLSLVLSCGGSALAGAAAVLLIINTSFDASVIDLSSKQSSDSSTAQVVPSRVQSPTSQSNASLEMDTSSANAVDAFSKHLTAGMLISHPELGRLAWTSEAITRIPPSDVSTGFDTGLNVSDADAENRNTLFQLKREIQL